jgi:hypothetical protein
MTIAGQSGNSYGVANVFFKGKSPLDQEFQALNTEAHLHSHPWVPDLPVFPTSYVADSFQMAKEAVFPAESELQLDRKLIAAQCVSGLRVEDATQWRDALQIIRATFADASDLQAWFDANYADKPFVQVAPLRVRNPYLGFDGAYLHLSADQFGVQDVFGAAQLCERILHYTAGPIEYGLSSPPPRRPTSPTASGRPALYFPDQIQATRLR